jgi:hypothetical protein
MNRVASPPRFGREIPRLVLDVAPFLLNAMPENYGKA